LSETIGKDFDVDNGSIQALENVAEKAAKMWLEFEAQPYRILIVMPLSNVKSQPSDKVGKAREGFL
jgi:hypothetical protein